MFLCCYNTASYHCYYASDHIQEVTIIQAWIIRSNYVSTYSIKFELFPSAIQHCQQEERSTSSLCSYKKQQQTIDVSELSHNFCIVWVHGLIKQDGSNIMWHYNDL